jgi:hypothetical protein
MSVRRVDESNAMSVANRNVMAMVKDLYNFVRHESSVMLGVLGTYLLVWALFAESNSTRRPGPVSWFINYLASAGISVPDWVRNMLLSPRPDMLLMMLLTALALAYCGYLVPAILIVTVEWHGFASTCWAYCVTVFVLSLVTAILASIDTEAFTPSYAVFNKIVVPAFAIPMFPFSAVLGMFDTFTRLPADVPEMPSDLALIKRRRSQNSPVRTSCVRFESPRTMDT